MHVTVEVHIPAVSPPFTLFLQHWQGSTTWYKNFPANVNIFLSKQYVD